MYFENGNNIIPCKDTKKKPKFLILNSMHTQKASAQVCFIKHIHTYAHVHILVQKLIKITGQHFLM